MAVKILELCNVAPPNRSAQQCTLPLTFFELLWYMNAISAETLLLFQDPSCSLTTFLSTHLPNLKRSLSLALELFYPLAGRLVLETDSDLPCIRYSDGDSVVLTVAESDDDLQELVSDGPKENARFRCLVPTLPMSEANYQPVMALQVTLFPERGIAVGISTLLVALDGSSVGHFLRTWASMCKSQSGEEVEPPSFYDGSRIWEPIGLQSPFFSRIKQGRSIRFRSVRPRPDVVRATFRLTTAKLEELRKWVGGRASHGTCGARFSSFTLAVALAWTCLLKARRRTPGEIEKLIFAVDCRARLDPPLPTAYFGNVLAGCLVEMEGRALIGEEGLAAAAVAIGEAIRGFPDGVGALRRIVESRVEKAHKNVTMEMLSVAGSPRMRMYEMDFGWGRPRKVEVVSIDGSGAMSLFELRRDGGGAVLEIGLAIPADVMEEFTKLFNTTPTGCSRL